MATTKKPSAKKTTTAKTEKEKPTKTPAKKRESAAALKKRIAELEEQIKQAAEEQGKMLELFTNTRIKLNAMLGQMLKALFIVGIGPDELMAKCQQMFRKNVVAD